VVRKQTAVQAAGRPVSEPTGSELGMAFGNMNECGSGIVCIAAGLAKSGGRTLCPQGYKIS